jgi:outer membrane biosynthesis protein TonB
MKRCPQCEFIYEDDQSLCDMDGALLVIDGRSLPNLHALAPIEVPLAARAHWRHRTFPAMAALILATVLSLVYFVSTQRTAPAPAALPISGTASIAPPISNSVAPASDTNQITPPPAEQPAVNGAAVTVREQSKPQPAKSITTPPPAAKKASAKTSTTQTKPAEEPKKEDSKVGSILKKTGRLLKKPFKL